jgi:hypothetical protein
MSDVQMSKPTLTLPDQTAGGVLTQALREQGWCFHCCNNERLCRCDACTMTVIGVAPCGACRTHDNDAWLVSNSSPKCRHCSGLGCCLCPGCVSTNSGYCGECSGTGEGKDFSN